MQTPSSTTAAPGAWARFLDGDVWFSFRHSPTAIVAAVIAALCIVCSVFAPWVSPHNPFDLATLNLSDARLPPAWQDGGSSTYLLGTDDQGRDLLSALFYGARLSLAVGFASVLLSLVVGVGLGLLSGFAGGKVDAFIMRLCDGKDSITSHTRMMKASTLPPAKPDSSPRPTPTTSDSNTDAKPTASDSRAP